VYFNLKAKFFILGWFSVTFVLQLYWFLLKKKKTNTEIENKLASSIAGWSPEKKVK
jgi:hypothetical protein